MYVRTKKGGIFDCYESEKMHKPIYYPKKSKNNGYIDYEDVYKKSDNIIDILEVGDYVNGEKVIRIFNPTFLSMGELPYVITDKSKYEPQEIKSIVTKEVFESMEYRIGE